MTKRKYLCFKKGGIFIKKKLTLILLILFVLVTISCVSAADDNQTDEIVTIDEDSINEEILTDENTETGTFSDFVAEMTASGPGKTFELTKDYTYNPETDSAYSTGMPIGITSLVIDGKGHTLSGNGQAGIIRDDSETNLIFKNIIFANANKNDDNFAALHIHRSATVINCTFLNNDRDGVYISDKGDIIGCTFINNSKRGAIIGYGTVEDCKFINNHERGLEVGGIGNLRGYVKNCTFENNTAKKGAGLQVANGITVEDCTFIRNSASEQGGAIYLYFTEESLNIVNCTFINNTAPLGPAFVIDNYPWTISNSTFENNDITLKKRRSSMIILGAEIKNSKFVNSKIINNLGNLTLSNNTMVNGYIENNGTILTQVYLYVPNYTQHSNGTQILAILTDDNGNSIHSDPSILNYFNIKVNDEALNTMEQVQINGMWFFKVSENLENGNYPVSIELIDPNAFEKSYDTCTITPGTLKVADIANYTELQNKINSEDNLIILENDYALFLPEEFIFENGINIDKDNVIIDGQGHTINGTSMAKFFTITGNNVTLKNIIFTDGFSANAGLITAYNYLCIENCTFANNKDEKGILYIKGNANVTDSRFENNHAESGVIITEGLLNITNSNFTGNIVDEGNTDIILIDEGSAIIAHNIPEDLKAEHIVYLTVDPVYSDYYPMDVKITAHITCEGNKMNTGNVQVSINGANYTQPVNNGMAILSLPNLEAGEYSVKVTFQGGDNYSSPSQSIKFTINKYSTMTIANDATLNINKDETYTVTVTDGFKPISGGRVNLIIDNETIASAVTDSNGIAKFQLPSSLLKTLGLGTHDMICGFEGDSYNAASGTLAKLTITKENIQIAAKSGSYNINYGGKYSITLKDSAGKTISGEKVTFTLNGKAIGTVTTDANGVATITLTSKILKAAKAGSKNLAISYGGNSKYNPASKTVKVTVNKESVKITAKKKTFKKAVKTKKYAITLKNSKGKAVKKAKVTIKVNGKTYKATTNAKGKATFKITKLTKKGKHTATVTYKTTATYKAASKKVIITIK